MSLFLSCQVILSHNKPSLAFPLHLDIQQATPVVKVSEDGSLHFKDGSVTQAEVLLLCTGYNFNFPFLCPSELGLEIQDHIVIPLYKFLLPPAFPSIFFVGICKIISPFVHFHCQVSRGQLTENIRFNEWTVSHHFNLQVQFALAVLEGSVKLPSKAEMEKDAQGETQRKLEKGVQVKHLLNMDSEQWGYNLELARMGRFTPLDPVIQSLYEEVGRQRRKQPLTYKQMNYRLIDATQWEILECPPKQADTV